MEITSKANLENSLALACGRIPDLDGLIVGRQRDVPAIGRLGPEIPVSNEDTALFYLFWVCQARRLLLVRLSQA